MVTATHRGGRDDCREHEQASAPADPTRAAHTQLAYDAVRERIASGTVVPGEWLREHAVATSLGLSRTPVREALRLLAAEGVVELVQNRGARVVDWSPEDIDEAYRLRALIEGYGAGLAARRADEACIAELRALQDRYERALASDDSAATPAQCNDDFHAAVLAAAGAPGSPCCCPRSRAPRSSAGSCRGTTPTTGSAASWRTATSSPRSRTATTNWPPLR